MKEIFFYFLGCRLRTNSWQTHFDASFPKPVCATALGLTQLLSTFSETLKMSPFPISADGWGRPIPAWYFWEQPFM